MSGFKPCLLLDGALVRAQPFFCILSYVLISREARSILSGYVLSFSRQELFQSMVDRLEGAELIRLRAALLEFLKFRVLAAEESFFEHSSADERRRWLKALFPQALLLSDSVLEQVWKQAYDLYGCH